MKGHVKLELKKSNGDIKTVEQDNLITNAIPNFIANSISSKGAMSTMTDPEVMMGGVLLFADTLTEDKNNIVLPTDIDILGVGKSSNDSSIPFLGTYISSESGVVENSYKFVWDFSPSQANGTIKAIALTNGNRDVSIYGGYFVYEQFLGSESFAYGGLDTLTVGGSSRNGYFPICIDENDNIYAITNSQQEVIKIPTTYNGKIHINKPKINVEVLKTLGNPNIIWAVNGFDGYAYVGYTSGSNYSIKKYKISDYSFADEGVVVSFPYASFGSKYIAFAVYNSNTIYAACYNGETKQKLRKVSLSGEITDLTEDIGAVKGIAPLSNDRILIVRNVGEFIFYPKTDTLSQVSKKSYDYLTAPLILTNRHGIKIKRGSRSFYIAQAFNYLATICNLETPIEKTSEQTLRVIYTITDV